MKTFKDGSDELLDRAVENLLTITDEYIDWSDDERQRLASRFYIVVGIFGEGKKSRRRAP